MKQKLADKPGLLALACGQLARYADARSTIENIRRPVGSLRGTWYSLSVAENFNQAAKALLANKAMRWLLLMNDDHFYPEDVLQRLLRSMDEAELDAVTAFYLERSLPFGPVLFHKEDSDGYHERRYVQAGERGLVPVEACGDGCLLVRRDVIEALAKTHGADIWELSAVTADKSEHDVIFCRKVRAAGFDIFANLDVTVGHITPMTVWPVQAQDGTWGVKILPRTDSDLGVVLGAPTEPPSYATHR